MLCPGRFILVESVSRIVQAAADMLKWSLARKNSVVFFLLQFECCMAGWKRVGKVEICRAPCCPGYREVVEKPAFLQPVVMCVKEPNHNDFDRLIQLRNDIHSYWQR